MTTDLRMTKLNPLPLIKSTVLGVTRFIGRGFLLIVNQAVRNFIGFRY